MASGIYNRFKANLMNKEVDLEADTINVALYDTNHSFTATDTDYTTTNELPTTGGYTLGGQALDTKAVTEAATTSPMLRQKSFVTSVSPNRGQENY